LFPRLPSRTGVSLPCLKWLPVEIQDPGIDPLFAGRI